MLQRLCHSTSKMQHQQLSANPPSPVGSSFRVGDWICHNPRCSTHNFKRNQLCIGCGTRRAISISQPTSPIPPRLQNQVQQDTRYHYAQPNPPTPQPSASRPILTPSGRAFAIGGRVQNISSDPLNPCIMYWPDNEPFPEQGQIRPSNVVGVAYPPIVNTGNRGPIAHQSGDWICKKCNYLNWRRRRVCQTCLPYAEGNGDSISSVQAERIALLTSILAQTSISPRSQPTTTITIPPRRSQSVTSPRQFDRYEHPDHSDSLQCLRQRHKSQSHPGLGDARPKSLSAESLSFSTPMKVLDPSLLLRPITLPFHKDHHKETTMAPPPPLLPRFLQEIVSSPSDSYFSELSDSEVDGSPLSPLSSASRFSSWNMERII
ncbi:hypothetical protein E1B28_012886 [Marasmius oreades]|uniref:RanBP2-type domain-containing protein n=1 Tax=Marasmius oreades TaxID=181124 RepID=A0A9P7RTI7_9AGAR|nr:uncharacterized protein E1B28_012886 [Marasmius oreades]KAG7088941.1 hypothetical protein E1B28_012886 [Marasmius oreades]